MTGTLPVTSPRKDAERLVQGLTEGRPGRGSGTLVPGTQARTAEGVRPGPSPRRLRPRDPPRPHLTASTEPRGPACSAQRWEWRGNDPRAVGPSLAVPRGSHVQFPAAVVGLCPRNTLVHVEPGHRCSCSTGLKRQNVTHPEAPPTWTNRVRLATHGHVHLHGSSPHTGSRRDKAVACPVMKTFWGA